MSGDADERRRSLRSAAKEIPRVDGDVSADTPAENESLPVERTDAEVYWLAAATVGVGAALAFLVLRPFGNHTLTVGEQALLSADFIGVGVALLYLAGLAYSRMKEHID